MVQCVEWPCKSGGIITEFGTLADDRSSAPLEQDPDRFNGDLMSMELTAEPLPLVADADGVVRVGKTRVTLDTIVAAFQDGLTAEEIAQQYPSLRLGEVYAVIGYYLCHQADVDAYLAAREGRANEVREENERRFNPVGVRSRLLARQTRQG
jgi:uncharacterized protein (DUF433 family)